MIARPVLIASFEPFSLNRIPEVGTFSCGYAVSVGAATTHSRAPGHDMRKNV
jgi:hypothetical protein